MFVEAIRRYLETLPPAQTGWLAGLRDPVVGQALAALHGEPARPGRSSGSRASSGLSRSVLAERFTEMVGQPPMQYLALWRMQLASRLLVDGGHGGGGRRRGRLRVGGGVQPRVQEAGRPGSGDVAADHGAFGCRPVEVRRKNSKKTPRFSRNFPISLNHKDHQEHKGSREGYFVIRPTVAVRLKRAISAGPPETSGLPATPDSSRRTEAGSFRSARRPCWCDRRRIPRSCGESSSASGPGPTADSM